MLLENNAIYEFEDFRLDLAEKTLRRGDEVVPLTPKVFETLLVFVENAGHLVEKDELMHRLWQERFVEESNLTYNIKMLRKALGDDAAKPRFIETVPTRGYRFIAEVRRVEANAATPGRGDAANVIHVAADSAFPYVPVPPSPRRRVAASQSGSVVALADWRPKEAESKSDDLPNDPDAGTAERGRVQPSYYYLLAGLVSVVLLVGLGYWFFAIRSANTQLVESIAVLPFQNASGDANLDYLSDGLSEGIIDRLSSLPELKVIARNSSFKFRGPEDGERAAVALGVRAIITGRVSLHRDGLTVRVELVDVRDNRQLWSQQYNRPTKDAPVLQEEITETISKQLSLKLSGVQEQQIARHKTLNPYVFELVLKGRFHAYKGGAENWKKAVEYYQQAISADPEYAPTYTGLFWAYRNLITRGVLDPKEFGPTAVIAARKALELDPNMAEAHLALAYIRRDGWKWSEAEASYKRGLELSPNLATAHGAYSAYLSVVGRHDEAVTEAKRAGELDPFSPLFNTNTGFALFLARRYDEAITALKNTLDLDPNNSNAHYLLGLSYMEKGLYPEAIAAHQDAARVDKVSPSLQISLGTAFARSGDRDQARAALKQLQEAGTYIPPTDLAIFHAALGEHDQAFAILEQAFAAHDSQLQYIGVGPAYDSLRTDPRFDDLLRRIGLAR